MEIELNVSKKKRVTVSVKYRAFRFRRGYVKQGEFSGGSETVSVLKAVKCVYVCHFLNYPHPCSPPLATPLAAAAGPINPAHLLLISCLFYGRSYMAVR